MDWNCCWTKEQIEPGECPNIRESDDSLRTLLSRRIAEKCFYCDRFRDDLRRLSEVDQPLARLVPQLIEGLRDQKNQIASMAGSLDSRNQEISFLHELAEVLQTTMNLDEVDPVCRLNYVPNKPQPAKIDYALSNSFGFGGTNGSLVFRRWTE